MDQDSELPENYVNTLYNSFKKLTVLHELIAGVGPLSKNKNNDDIYLFNQNNNEEIIAVSETLSSGFMTSAKVYKLVGKRDENLFIDYVDWEWNWRAKSKNLTTFVDTNLIINHMLGDGHKSIFIWKVGIPNPIRHYYQYRNSFILLKYSYVPFIWKLKRIIVNIVKLLIYVLFFDQKIKRFKYIYLGIKDFFMNKKGKL